MLHRRGALFLVAHVVAMMMSVPLVSAACASEYQAWRHCVLSDSIACECINSGNLPDDPGVTWECQDFRPVCLYVNCCIECARPGASYINCYMYDLDVCGDIECHDDGTFGLSDPIEEIITHTDPPVPDGTSDPATDPDGTSGAATNTGAVLVMMSIAALYYVI